MLSYSCRLTSCAPNAAGVTSWKAPLPEKIEALELVVVDDCSTDLTAERLTAYLQSDPDIAKEWNATRKLKDDPRVTAIGTMLRRSSIDELPQLINVLRGEMSLVGPRPVVVDELTRYGALVTLYLSARPGLTGLWQVSGRSDTSYDQRVRLDADYLSRFSLVADTEIILKTVPALFSQRGSY